MVKFTKKIVRENFFEAIRKGRSIQPKSLAGMREGAPAREVLVTALSSVIAPVADVIGRSANMVIAPGKGRGVIRGGLLAFR